MIMRRAREMSPSRMVDAGTIGDGSEEEMLNIDGRGGWNKGSLDGLGRVWGCGGVQEGESIATGSLLSEKLGICLM